MEKEKPAILVRFDAIYTRIGDNFFHWPSTEKPLPRVVPQNDPDFPTAASGKD